MAQHWTFHDGPWRPGLLRLDGYPLLAELYDPLATPRTIISAHRALDRAVDRSFGKRQALVTDSERLAVLFARYEQLITGSELPGLGPRLKDREVVPGSVELVMGGPPPRSCRSAR